MCVCVCVYVRVCVRVCVQVLLALPAAARQDYFPLLSDPLLILEQLLMNLKVEWAGAAVATLRALLPGPDAGVSLQDVDTLLSSYACKALDFPYAPRERTRSGQTPCRHTRIHTSDSHVAVAAPDRSSNRHLKSNDNGVRFPTRCYNIYAYFGYY